MTPHFKNAYTAYLTFYTKEGSSQDSTVVLADSLMEAIDKAGEYAQAVMRNDHEWVVFDVTGIVLKDTIFIGLEDETVEQEFTQGAIIG